MKATFKSGDMKMHLEENIGEGTRKCSWLVTVWPVEENAGSSNFKTFKK